MTRSISGAAQRWPWLPGLAAASFVVSTSPADAALSSASPPRITGKAQVGKTLKATRGVWRGQYELPVTTQYTYQCRS